VAKLLGVKQNNHFPDSHSKSCLLTVWVLSMKWTINESLQRECYTSSNHQTMEEIKIYNGPNKEE
jgi:hypothetical protein